MDKSHIINTFFKYNIYYYNKICNIYFNYNKHNYIIINEDELIYRILYFITKIQHRISTKLKYILKNEIHRLIKNKTIFHNIPDTVCIQNIINFFYPNFLINIEYSKYFLTVIGDIIMKKNDLIYYVPNSIKSFLVTLNKYICTFFRYTNLINKFRFDNYIYGNYEKCRIFKMNNININYFNLNSQFIIDIICVCLHYSSRYDSSELYLHNTKSLDVYINETSKINIIDDFINIYIQKNNINYITKKDMLFIWNMYLLEYHKMKIIKNSEFILKLSNKIELKGSYFIGVTSIHLPYVINFRTFWENNIEEDLDNEYKISELLLLFHNYYDDKITRKVFINLINFYYPNIIIINNRYVKKIKCKLWDKKKSLDNYKGSNTNINDLYEDYCKYNKFKVSKNYFIKYI
jgi:hypothetical protein